MLPLKSLHIHRFRGLVDVELPELGRFNVLVGRNNSGKSTILEAIATHGRALHSGEWVEVARRRDVTSTRTALLEGLRWLFPQPLGAGAHASSLFEGDTRVSSTGSVAVHESTARFTEIEAFFEKDPEGDSVRLVDWVPWESGTRRGAKLELRAVGREGTTWPPSVIVFWEGQRLPIMRNLSGASLPVTTITPFSHRVQKIEVEALSDALFADLKPTVLDLIRIFDPDIQDLEILQRSRSEPAVYLRHAVLGKAPLTTFGDGIRRVLLMGVSLAMVKGGILLVDEIESAIHVEALDASFRWLQRACRELDVQLFTTTHSLEAVDALLAAADGEDDLVVYRLEQKDGRAQAKRFSSKSLHILREELGQEIRA